jgi:hypothetical protein
MRTLDDPGRLLDLLREAGDEAVTLDELHVVGVHDPAAALLALELAGHGVERVIETAHAGRTVTCVRLAAERAAQRAAAAAERPVEQPATTRRTRPTRPILIAFAAALLVLLVAARRR